jgi:putative pre-16S rRNA nuclease
MATLALDLGKRRIGVAICDDDASGALPLGFLERRSLSESFKQLERLVTERGVIRIVVGLPLNMDGSEGPAARSARTFAQKLGDRLGVAVELADERLSSVEAEQRLAAGGTRAKRKRAAIDAVAATIILEDWLEARRRAR